MKSPLVLLHAATVIAAAITWAPRSPEEDSKLAFLQLQQKYQIQAPLLMNEACNAENALVRKSWAALTRSERTEYLNAVQCLNDKPTTLDLDDVPGARTRRDDFIWSHLRVGNFVHSSGLLLPWHREFVWRYERALRDECGYQGAQPYWDWAETAEDQLKSPVFDGSETSFGSNGVYYPHGPVVNTLVNITLNGSSISFTRQPGTGGGCVTDGFFRNLTLNIGPVSPPQNPDNPWALTYNPRCLTRDMNNNLSSTALNWTSVMSLMSQPDIRSFHPNLELNMHALSHAVAGGELDDFYSSPNDPAFFLLHAQHDRHWTIWQAQDYGSRMNALDGTLTAFNSPPSANATLDSVMNMEVVGGEVRVGDAMSTISGRFCYVYE